MPATSMARTAGMERGAESSSGSSSTCENGRKKSPQPAPPPRPPRNAPGGAQSGQEQGAKRPKPMNSLSVAVDDDVASADAVSNESKARSGPGGRYKRGQRLKHQPQLLTAHQETIIMLQCELEQAKWATLEARRFAAPPLAEPRENEDVD